LCGPISNLLSSLSDAYLRYLRESLRGCRCWAGVTLGGFGAEGRGRFWEAQLHQLCSPWLFSASPVLCLSGRADWEDVTGYLPRAAKAACVGSGWLFSILQLPGLFCRKLFPYWCRDSVGTTFAMGVTSLSAALG